MTYFNEKYIYGFLVCLALLSGWLAQYTGLIEPSKTPIAANQPDYFSKGYTKWEMDETGQLKSKLVAEEMTHYVQYWASHTKKPVIQFNSKDSPPWLIESTSGIMSNDGKKLRLIDKVTLNRAKSQNGRQLTINTSDVMVSPEIHYAETQAFAELISPPNITTGTGMKLTFKEPIHLELLSKVKGKYETK